MNEKPRDASSLEVAFMKAGLARMAADADAPSLSDAAGSRSVEAWFLGPKAENAEEFERLVVRAVRDHAGWRRNYHPGDPTHVTEAIKRSPEYLAAASALSEGYDSLLAFLKKSVPFFSMRYQGHMNWDLTIPGMLGYFATMLYNPNNVAFEGSTATTFLELLVGDDLCQMLGYMLPEPGAVRPRPWGHITCDGTVANIEALWAARNARFFALAVRAALADDTHPDLAAARGLAVLRHDGSSGRLIDLDNWEVANLPSNEVLELSGRIHAEFGLDARSVDEAVQRHSLQQLGLAEFSRRFLSSMGPPRVLVPGTKHYSFPKAVALLGLGADSLIDVPVDLDARQDLDALRKELERCLAERSPVIAVVAVIGTTEESAIDPLAGILELRAEFARRGLAFHVHADAAWGGYHRSLLNDNFGMPEPQDWAPPPAAPLSVHATRNLRALSDADTITVDPHKSGYIPYPAGALCYRNSAMRNLVTFSAPVVFHGGAEPTVGIYGIEGSKPGAAVAAVYLSHRVIRPTPDGYGKIIGEALFSCRKLYAQLLSLSKDGDPFVLVPVPRLPAERAGRNRSAVEVEAKAVESLLAKTGEEIRLDGEAMALLREIGPDQNILSYAFNYRDPAGGLNPDGRAANRLNAAIYRRLSIRPGNDIYGSDMIVSTTDFDERAYGVAFMDNFRRRMGIMDGTSIATVLRSVVMDPWVTDTTKGSFVTNVLAKELRKAVLGAVGEVFVQARGF